MNFLETVLISLKSISGNRLRTFLTILGVVVGIFSIIVIMTIITMLQNTIENGISFLSKNTFQVMKFPAINTGGRSAFEKYRNRKDITLEDFYRLEGLLSQAKYMGADLAQGNIIVKYGNKETNPNIWVSGITVGVHRTANLNIEVGREIRETDVQYSTNVCLLGPDVVDKLFPSINPVGQNVTVSGRPLLVIGVLEKRPAFFGQSFDNYIIVPITTFHTMFGGKNGNVDITIMSYSQEDYESTIEATIGYMRTIRKVLPGKENDFEIMSNESLIGQIGEITGGVKIGAMVVSIIALLAAGVGIMNIMLVSVTERTHEIGIRKAVGANKKNILFQFLIEAITLCLVGGIVGILLGIGIGNIAGSFLSAGAAIPYDWVLIGLLLCIIVGIIFGTYPAYKAANLDPIEALRYE
ncbi:MAG TPA: ABC transporter permease [Ignavibacteriaceae bacterium]|nr:ABC transporter permease [Ignavibacteriaceae bacterium]